MKRIPYLEACYFAYASLLQAQEVVQQPMCDITRDLEHFSNIGITAVAGHYDRGLIAATGRNKPTQFTVGVKIMASGCKRLVKLNDQKTGLVASTTLGGNFDHTVEVLPPQ